MSWFLLLTCQPDLEDGSAVILMSVIRIHIFEEIRWLTLQCFAKGVESGETNAAYSIVLDLRKICIGYSNFPRQVP